jgi:hypothetical protein
MQGDPVIAEPVRHRVLEEDHPADAAHFANRVKVRGPLLDASVVLGQGLAEARPRWRLRLATAAQVLEVVLVQDHPAVLEPQPPRELGELGVRPGGLALAAQLGQLGVQRVHLLHVAGIELQVLGDLRVRDAIQPAQVVKLLLFVSLGFPCCHLSVPPKREISGSCMISPANSLPGRRPP